jgi:hypothetical protein
MNTSESQPKLKTAAALLRFSPVFFAFLHDPDDAIGDREYFVKSRGSAL